MAHAPGAAAQALRWLSRDEAVVEIGAARWPDAGAGFAYDNETPRHRVLVPAHAIAHRPVTNADFATFVAEGGYATPTLWLSDGWDHVQRAACVMNGSRAAVDVEALRHSDASLRTRGTALTRPR